MRKPQKPFHIVGLRIGDKGPFFIINNIPVLRKAKTVAAWLASLEPETHNVAYNPIGEYCVLDRDAKSMAAYRTRALARMNKGRG